MIGLNWASSMKNILNKKQDNFSIKKLDWKKIQFDMKEKLGNDIYESWLKKIDFIDRKQSNPDGFPGLVRIYCCSI